MQTPADKTLTLTFASHPTKDLAWRWKAMLDFPAGSDETTVLRLRLEDGTGAVIAKGVFEFAGQRLVVTDGEAEIAYRDFVAGLHSTALWLHRAGLPPIPGGLTFE